MGITYISVAQEGEIAPGQMKAIELAGRPVVVANVAGTYFVFSRDCPHEGADLATGELSHGLLRCSNHSHWYDLATGECVQPEGEDALTVLPVEQRGQEICVRLEW